MAAVTNTDNSGLSMRVMSFEKTGVPGEKPLKHRRNQLQELHSHQTRLSFFFVRQYSDSMQHPYFPTQTVKKLGELNDLNAKIRSFIVIWANLGFFYCTFVNC